MRSSKKNKFIFVFGFFCFVAANRGEEAKGKSLFIKGGTVYTITMGVIPSGDILIKGGKIEKVGKNIVPPKDAVVIEAENKWVMPGFVIAHANPISIRPVIEDDNTPKVANYIDPFGLEIRLCLATGITSYSSNLPYNRVRKKSYSFVNAVIKPVYGRLEEMLISEPAYLFVDMPSLTLSEKDELRGFFERAADYVSRELEYKRKKDLSKAAPPPLPPDLTYYIAIIKGEMPVRFSANSKKDILKVLAFIDEFSVRGQIVGAGEGWLIAGELGRRNISTILQPEAYIRADPSQYPPNGFNIKNALIQKERGTQFSIVSSYLSIGTGGTIGTDLLTFPLAGAYAIRGGLDETTALRAITLTAAEQLGMGQRIGSLEAGKDADIIVLDGNPFDYRTYVEYTIVNGEILYDKDKSPLYKKIPKPKLLF